MKKSQLPTKGSKRSPAQFAMMAGRSRQSPLTSLDNEDTEQSPSPLRCNKGGFVYPMASAIELYEANERWFQALKHVSESDVSNSSGKRSNATLYLGNVDYNASEQDIYNAVAPTFQHARVDKVIIPRVHGRSMYVFIEISWPQATLNVSDICISRNTGTITVNGLPIYFRESRNKAGSQ